MIRAAFIITGLSTGGSETMLLKVLERIDRTRFSCYVVSLSDKGEIGPRIEALRIPVFALGMRSSRLKLSKFAYLVKHLRALKPDLVHTWMYHADLIGGLAARVAGVRAIGWRVNHSNLDPALNRRSTLWVMRACARLSSWLPRKILSCSEKAYRVHVDAGYSAGKMSVVPNGFDLSRFRPDAIARDSVRRELKLGSSQRLVGLIARYHPQKNIEGFVEAAHAVASARPDVHFVMAGSGLESTNILLRKAIACTPFAARFHLLGRRDDVPRLMAALDVFALSSHGEAFPNVVGEAMACGVPCVVTDVGDSAEIVGATGRIVSAGDMVRLGDEIVALLDLPPLERVRLGQQARERVREKYEIDSVVEQYQRFYLSLMDEAKQCVE